MSASQIPEMYRRLEDENNLFQCNLCGYYAGDSRSHNFLSRCPDCDRIARFYRLIE